MNSSKTHIVAENAVHIALIVAVVIGLLGFLALGSKVARDHQRYVNQEKLACTDSARSDLALLRCQGRL